jgi:predicted transcriptional regulator
MEPVLINQVTAAGIAEGRIAVVLRRWDAPRAKAGGTQRTPAGTIRIEHVAEHSGTYRVTRTQAVAAGFPDAKSAQAELDRRPAAHTYVITVSYLAPDERHALAASDQVSTDDAATVSSRLERWDVASSDGPWTRRYLELIAANEGVRAPELAATVGQETARFKRRVRQLKGLGLTISLEVGYRISPRGKAFLAG